MAAFDPDAYLATTTPPPTSFDPDAYLRATQPVVALPSEVPGPRRAPATSAMGAFGRSAASLADVTLGGILPATVQTVAYPVLRAFGRTPEEATASSRQMGATLEAPFGKAFGVAGTPEYEQEAGRQLMAFIGENVQKGAKWLSEKTGLPQTDIENMLATGTLAVPKVVGAGVQGVKAVAATPAAQEIRAGLQMPFEPTLQARRERLSAESYARGPQIDAALEAQRLKLALNPPDIQPSTGPRVTSALAGARGEEIIQRTNRPRVNEIARNEMGMPPTAQLNDPKTFDAARAAVAAPYDKIKKIPTIQADEGARASLQALRPAETMIGGETAAAKINSLIDSALTQVDAGMSGQAFLDNVSKLRKDARRIYRNKNALPEQIDLAETNLAIANVLEGMIEKSVFDPKLLAEYRVARQKMAQIYAYEAATDFNTGFVDPGKIARVTAKDNALTGDIASLGRIAGNFPGAFSPQTGTPWYTTKVSRAGFGGAGGAIVGGALGGLVGAPVGGTIIGTALGGLAGEAGSRMMANRLASPAYQAGLQVRDYRIPAPNQLAPQVGPQNALVPYVAPQTVLMPGEGAFVPNIQAPLLRQKGGAWTVQNIPREDIYVAPTPREPQVTIQPNPRFVGPEGSISALPYDPNVPRQGQPGAFEIMRARERELSMQKGQQTEAQQAAAEAAARRPAGREVMLEIDPVTGKLREASQGIKGATPETFRNFGANLESAAQKVTAGKTFDLTAAEKVAWERTKVDLSEVAPGFKALSDKAIAEKMMDRQWVEGAVAKAREKAAAFDAIAARAKDAQARQTALVNRERMMDLLASLEENLRAPRPQSGGGQGPKTRAFKRNQLAPESESVNALNKP